MSEPPRVPEAGIPVDAELQDDLHLSVVTKLDPGRGDVCGGDSERDLGHETRAKLIRACRRFRFQIVFRRARLRVRFQLVVL